MEIVDGRKEKLDERWRFLRKNIEIMEKKMKQDYIEGKLIRKWKCVFLDMKTLVVITFERSETVKQVRACHDEHDNSYE